MTTFAAVIRALEAHKNAIDRAISSLKQADIEEVKSPNPQAEEQPSKRRQLSADARRAIGDATRARWAAAKRKRRSSL